MITRLKVFWRTLETPETSSYFITVGYLSKEKGRELKSFYRFRYAHGANLQQARNHGFREVPGFPIVDPNYSTISPHLFPTFAQWIPNRKRPDFQRMMDYWGVKNTHDPFEILGRMRGTTLAHRLEIGFDRGYRPGD